MAIPYSQGIRCRRIIDEDSQLDQHLNILKQKILKRNYPSNIIEQQLNKIKQINRLDTLRYKTLADKKQEFENFTGNKPFLPLILTFNHKFNTQKKYY